MEASHLLRFLYEREYGPEARKAEHNEEAAAADLARRAAVGRRHIPIDPDYHPE